MRIVKLPIPRVNLISRPSMRPSMPKSSGRKRSSRTTTVRVEVSPVAMPAARKSTVAEKIAYVMAGSILVGFAYVVCSTAPGVSPVAPETRVSADVDSSEVTSSDIYDAPETSAQDVPAATGCDAYVPAKYRLCSTPIDSSRYPLKAKTIKRQAKRSAASSSPSVTTTTTVRKSTSATGAKSTTTTKSVRVSK